MTQSEPSHNYCVVVLLELVEQFRDLKPKCGYDTYAAMVAPAEPNGGALTDLAEILDKHSLEEVDAELEKLWQGVLASSASNPTEKTP